MCKLMHKAEGSQDTMRSPDIGHVVVVGKRQRALETTQRHIVLLQQANAAKQAKVRAEECCEQFDERRRKQAARLCSGELES